MVLFGFDPAELDTAQWTELASRHLYAAPAPAVRADPAGQARQARAYLERPHQPLQVNRVTCVYASLLLLTHQCVVPHMVTTLAASSLKIIPSQVLRSKSAT